MGWECDAVIIKIDPSVHVSLIFVIERNVMTYNNCQKSSISRSTSRAYCALRMCNSSHVRVLPTGFRGGDTLVYIKLFSRDKSPSAIHGANDIDGKNLQLSVTATAKLRTLSQV